MLIRAVPFRVDTVGLPRHSHGVITRRLGSFAALTVSETQALRAAGGETPRSWARQTRLDHRHTPPSFHRYIVSGWAAHTRDLGDGRRQLVDLLLPGDIAKPLARDAPGQAIVCITAVSTINGKNIQAAAQESKRYPGIVQAVQLAAEEERARLMNHAVRLGRLTAYERLANLFGELHRRCDVVGLIQGRELKFPLTREMLGDLLGLSSVHVNRSLQLLRRDGLASVARGYLNFFDIEALKLAGHYRHQEAMRQDGPSEPLASNENWTD